MACNFFSSPLSLRKKGYNENLFIRRCTYEILSAFVFPFYPQKKFEKPYPFVGYAGLEYLLLELIFPFTYSN